MKVNLKCIHCEVDKHIQEFLKEKIYEIGNNYDWLKMATIYLKIEKNNQNKDKIVELLITAKKFELFTKGQAETFVLASLKAINAMKHQVSKQKAKHFSHAVSTPI
jgi:putative sigma-54 modulation protein